MTRFAWVMVTYFSAVATTASIFIDPAKKLIWNASASVPVGLYRIVRADRLDVTDLAVVMPPDDLADFLDERRYLPRGLPLLKRVLALSGTTVCRNGAEITAYGMAYGQARERDGQGRPLPVWQGCRTLRVGEAFFMKWDSPDSFDSRYFGPLPLSTVVGRAIPLWTTDDPDPVVETFREPVSDEP
ncbi:S26 family signal peptidase [Agrobacterium sp. CNPSo 2736]|uniref:S26 family signal peptidase n=1 Tax=Agrobacterium sp. CNPSo 2736 TaxID=2499627 RepID=UPI000FD7D27D|nr:S26 family signal peptidase [Agrobacterium sp. CNPSo 2736]RVT73052.1 S26 family signal peptidase [Agrobacterium sp. CNPSo 2736]